MTPRTLCWLDHWDIPMPTQLSVGIAAGAGRRRGRNVRLARPVPRSPLSLAATGDAGAGDGVVHQRDGHRRDVRRQHRDERHGRPDGPSDPLHRHHGQRPAHPGQWAVLLHRHRLLHRHVSLAISVIGTTILWKIDILLKVFHSERVVRFCLQTSSSQ